MRSRRPARFGVPATVGLCLASLAIAACGPSTIVVPPADDLYQSASESHETGGKRAAIDTWKQLLDQYPLDPRAEEIELKIADAYYEERLYPEAIAAYGDFQRMHPTSRETARVEYQIGLAYMEQMKTSDRDQGSAKSAAQQFESVISRFPNSEYGKKATEKLLLCRENLADREYYIAEFYARRGNQPAARSRVKGLLGTYPETTAASQAAHELEATGRLAEDPELASLAGTAQKRHEATQGVREAAQAQAAAEKAAQKSGWNPIPKIAGWFGS